MISILILTLNEEENIQKCLESVAWSDDVVVLDSFSTDKTVEIAKAAGARVVQRKFDNWAAHQNWALDNIAFKYPWVYYSDADEVVTPELREELKLVAEEEGNTHVAYRLRYKNYFCGKWIKHCGIYPTWVLRFFQPKRIRWERLVNPTAVVDGPEGRLEEHFEHYSFNKGLIAWFDKHNKYSWSEAVESLKSLEAGGMHWGKLWSRSTADRRRALKELSFRIPFRPVMRFIYMFLVKRGFMDGRTGLRYCVMLSIYEYMIVLKMMELRRKEQGLGL